MLEIESGLIIALAPETVLHSLPYQGWFFAFNVESGDQFRLNQTSFWVLETIGEGIEWSDLRDRYFATFAVSEDQGEVDLLKLLQELYEQGIIRRKSDAKE